MADELKIQGITLKPTAGSLDSSCIEVLADVVVSGEFLIAETLDPDDKMSLAQDVSDAVDEAFESFQEAAFEVIPGLMVDHILTHVPEVESTDISITCISPQLGDHSVDRISARRRKQRPRQSPSPRRKAPKPLPRS